MNTDLQSLPEWALMWATALGIYLVAKGWMTWRLLRSGAGLTMVLSFAGLWVGMDTTPWRKVASAPLDPAVAWRMPLVNICTGVWLIWGVARHITSPWWAGWCGMVGLILLLHFGLFALLAWWWNRCGIAVRPIMAQPWRARSLAEFWGQRWNRAFRDLAQAWIFKPLLRRWGAGAAMWAVFLFSGVVHDIVISLPAEGGYGGPLLYFLIQAAGISVERRLALRSRLYTFSVLVLPLGLLFHAPFVERVMVPFFYFIGALP